MKRFLLALFLALGQVVRADLTIVQKIEGVTVPGAPEVSQVTIMMKGTKTRIDTGAMVSMIIDTQSGDMITLVHQQKQIVRISADRAKAMAEMVNKSQNRDTKQSKLVATGKTELIDGMETDIYTADTAQGKATYWIAKNYPNAQEILKQMQAMQPGQWNLSNTGMPDFRDFPGLPVKTVIEMGGKPITSKLASVKQESVPESAFKIPSDYAEMKLPQIFGGGKPAPGPEASAAPSARP